MTFHSSIDDRFSSVASFKNVAAPERQDEELLLIQNLKEGDTVRYQSNTHRTDMPAKVLKILYENGKITRIDLDVKKKANICKISMVTREEGEADRMRSGAAPMREAHIPTSHVNAARGERSMGHKVGESHRCASRPWDEKFASLVENHRASLDDFPASPTSSAPTSKAGSPDQVKRKFAPGQKVKYFSSSYNQYIDAKVLDVKADGTYNLDVKKGAKEEHINAFEEADPQTAVHSSPKARPHQETQQPSCSPLQEQCQQPRQQQTSQPVENDVARPAKPSAVLYSSRQAAAFMPEQSQSCSSSSLLGSRLAEAAADCSDCLQRQTRAASSHEVSSFAGEARSDAAVPRQALAPPYFIGVGTEWLRPVVPAIPSTQSSSSSAAARSLARSETSDKGCATAADLRIDVGGFDPTEAPLRLQILSRLGFTSSATIEKMTGFSGGLNQGIWFLSGSRSGSHEELVLKLVRCSRIAPNVPTEAENLEKLRVEYPKLVNESLVAFPMKILRVADANGCKCNDLIVMRKIPGERLAELFCRKYYGKQEEHLFQICEEIGRLLADFHRRYDNMQHGDFQPSNVFYDEASDSIAFIDIGGMGIPTVDDDVSHFRQAMNLLANVYGPTLHASCIKAFDRGYQT